MSALPGLETEAKPYSQNSTSRPAKKTVRRRKLQHARPEPRPSRSRFYMLPTTDTRWHKEARTRGPASNLDAWNDLPTLQAYGDADQPHNLPCSLRFLAKRWGWSMSKVRRYMETNVRDGNLARNTPGTPGASKPEHPKARNRNTSTPTYSLIFKASVESIAPKPEHLAAQTGTPSRPKPEQRSRLRPTDRKTEVAGASAPTADSLCSLEAPATATATPALNETAPATAPATRWLFPEDQTRALEAGSKATATPTLPTPTAPVPADELAHRLVFADGKITGHTPRDVENWERRYPHLDIVRTIRKAAGHLDSIPGHSGRGPGKTAGFVNSWLSREDVTMRGGTGKKRVREMRGNA